MEITGNTPVYDQPTTATESQMKRPQPDPVDTSLANELEQRIQYASSEASWYEESARRHRAVEVACRTALDSLNSTQAQPQQAPGY